MTTESGLGRIVWLASYPKSGNTWVRAIATALRVHPHLFAVDDLISGGQPNHVGAALGVFGLDPRWLSETEIDLLRTALTERIGVAAPEHADGDSVGREVVLRKTHETYRTGTDDRQPFPTDATSSAILIVRDPRDVACSYAPFFGITVDEAIAAMAREGGAADSNQALAQTAQPWGTWSSHAMSWLDADVPFPVHVLRYEDLLADALGTLSPVFNAVGVHCTEEALREAVDRAQFDRLQASEAERGFRETHRRTEQFFRRGTSGGWRDELSPQQVAAIEADHAPMMRRLGYEVTTPESALGPLREARESRRREGGHDWTHLPEGLGLTVREGDVPEVLADAARPRPWIHVAPDAALLSFAGGSRLLVTGGSEVTVQRSATQGQTVDEGDLGWLVQGWGVTLAMLQRGLLSLHAATVQVDGQVVAVAGDRGAGKSTTAMGLRGRGHPILCDDVTLIEFRHDGAWTTPYSRNVHLLEDAADAVGVDFDALPALSSRRRKAAFRPEDPLEEPHRIDRIIVLSPQEAPGTLAIDHPGGSARMTALLDHTRRDGIAPLILGQERYFAQVAHLADVVPLTVITRARDEWSLDAVLDAIEAESRARD